MPGITKFGVWEKETREFIDAVSGDSKELKDSLTEWLYSSGIKITQMEQQKVHSAFNNEALKKDGKRPEVTLERIVANKKVGFNSVYLALLEKFAADNDVLRTKIEEQYGIYLKKAIENHQGFYQLQAEITTQLNQHMNTNPDVKMSTEDSMAFVVNQYVEAGEKHPELKDDISSQLTLQKEFSVMLKSIPTPSVATSPSTLYGLTPAVVTEQKAEHLNRPLVRSSGSLFKTCG